MFIVPVSYTHLRAHETEADLVCRLLLEKKIKYVFLSKGFKLLLMMIVRLIDCVSQMFAKSGKIKNIIVLMLCIFVG